jgi:hypothetical protein
MDMVEGVTFRMLLNTTRQRNEWPRTVERWEGVQPHKLLSGHWFSLHHDQTGSASIIGGQLHLLLGAEQAAACWCEYMRRTQRSSGEPHEEDGENPKDDSNVIVF